MTAKSSGDDVLAEGRIDQQALEAFRGRIGMKLRVSNVFNEHVTPEAIRKFVNGIGDTNPLFRDPAYAAGTRFGRLTAPPNWAYSVFPTWVLQGLPGVHAFHSGNDWEFYKPILVGDVITPECIFTGFEEKESRFAGRFVMEYQEARYLNQRGELVSKAKTWLVRAERPAARERGQYHSPTLPPPRTDGGVGKKPSDKWAVPLCVTAHEALHHQGQITFESRWCVDLKSIAEVLAERSPAFRKRERAKVLAEG